MHFLIKINKNLLIILSSTFNCSGVINKKDFVIGKRDSEQWAQSLSNKQEGSWVMNKNKL